MFPRTCFLLSLPIMSDILPFSGVPPQKLLPLARCEGNPLGEARTPKSQETCSQADPPGDEAPCTSFSHVGR